MKDDLFDFIDDLCWLICPIVQTFLRILENKNLFQILGLIGSCIEGA